jgi:hypothetical protein
MGWEQACDPQLCWVAIAEALQERRCAELADIAFRLFGQLGEVRAENDRLRASLQSCLCGPRRDKAGDQARDNGSHPESYAVLIASTRLRAFSLVTIAVR